MINEPSFERVASTLSPSLSLISLVIAAGMRSARLLPHLDIWIFTKKFFYRYTLMYIYFKGTYLLRLRKLADFLKKLLCLSQIIIHPKDCYLDGE